MNEEKMKFWIEAKREEKRKQNLNDPNFIELQRRHQEIKKQLADGYRPIKTSEIEELFLKWVKVDYSRKRYFKIETLMEHIIERETSLNNDVEYLKKWGNQTAFSSILAKLCIKYNANCCKFNDGKKRYSLTLI